MSQLNPHGTPPDKEPPARVRVTAPQPGSSSEQPLGAHESSDPAALYMRSLIRSQRRLAIVCACGFGLVLLLVPLLFALVPGFDEARIGAVPVSWIVLGAGMFPVMIAIAALFERAATRNESRYRALADDPDDDA